MRVPDTKALVAHERAHPECVDYAKRLRKLYYQRGAYNAAATIREKRQAS